jgi:DNA-binding IclR family transcriptional regulator
MNTGNTGDQLDETKVGRIGSLETTFTIVTALREFGKAGVTELAAETGLSKSTVHKHLATLIDHDFAVKEGDQYRLGLGFLEVGGHVRNEFQGVRRIKPKVQEIADHTNEAAQFMIEQHGTIIVLFREASQQGVHSQSRVGSRFYMHQSAAGKAILAQFSEDRVDAIVKRHGLPEATENTITDRATLADELATIRDRGFAINDAESTDGLRAVAVPMFAPDKSVLGAFAVVGPAHRLDEERASSDIPNIVQSVINELELNLTYL